MTKKCQLFIFEGVDMTGKSTVSRHVSEQLSLKYPGRVSYYRAPGGTENAEKIRDAARTMNLKPFNQGLLFLTALSDLRDQITEDIKDGKIIILDRWLWSTLAYQVSMSTSREALHLRGIIEEIHYPYNTCFYLSVTPEVLEERIASVTRPEIKDRFESSTPEYRKKILDSYEEMFCQGHRLPGGIRTLETVVIDTVVNDIESVKTIALGRVLEAVTK